MFFNNIIEICLLYIFNTNSYASIHIPLCMHWLESNKMQVMWNPWYTLLKLSIYYAFYQLVISNLFTDIFNILGNKNVY